MGADAHNMIGGCLDGSDVMNLSVIEIGSRHQNKGSGSTNFFVEYCTKKGAEFWTVDIDPVVTQGCKAVTPNAICAKGEDFLASYSGKPIVFVYFDNFDWTYAGVEHVPKVRAQAERYRTVHHIERTNVNSQEAHLKQAEALLPHLHTTAYVLFDDTWKTEAGGYDGKGGSAIPFMLQNGFSIVSEGGIDNPHVLMRRG